MSAIHAALIVLLDIDMACGKGDNRVERMSLEQARKAGLLGAEAKQRKKNSETIIQNAIRDALRAYGWYVIRHQQGIGSHPGMCDLTALKNGKTIYIEVKTPKGNLSADQETFREWVIAQKCPYLLARSVDDVLEFIKNVEESKG